MACSLIPHIATDDNASRMLSGVLHIICLDTFVDSVSDWLLSAVCSNLIEFDLADSYEDLIQIIGMNGRLPRAASEAQKILLEYDQEN